MKIDNKGWGLNTLILMICVIVVFLFIATYFAIRYNSMMGKQNNKSEEQVQKVIDQTYYINKENNMTSAAEKYIFDNDIKLSDFKLKISLATLISNNYMDNVVDPQTQRNCSGYTLAYINESNIKIIKSFIKCQNYESKGYGEN